MWTNTLLTTKFTYYSQMNNKPNVQGVKLAKTGLSISFTTSTPLPLTWVSAPYQQLFTTIHSNQPPQNNKNIKVTLTELLTAPEMLNDSNWTEMWSFNTVQ